MKVIKQQLKGIKMNHIMKLRYFNRETTGVIYQNEEGFHLEFKRILDSGDHEIVSYYLTAEDTLDEEDMRNINEILHVNNLEFVSYLKGV